MHVWLNDTIVLCYVWSHAVPWRAEGEYEKREQKCAQYCIPPNRTAPPTIKLVPAISFSCLPLVHSSNWASHHQTFPSQSVLTETEGQEDSMTCPRSHNDIRSMTQAQILRLLTLAVSLLFNLFPQLLITPCPNLTEQYLVSKTS